MRVNRPAGPLGAATARAPFEQPKTIAASLLRSVLDGLPADRRWVILDLGTIHPRMLELLEGRRCRVDVADLVGEFHVAEAGLDGVGRGKTLLLPPVRDPEPADLVLCWDLLNYLDCTSLERLMAQVATRCRSGALVHALVVYSERVMHELPGQLIALDAGTLLDVAATGAARPAPRYSTEALSQAMPDYVVDRVRLLTNGMQEYLFKTRPVRDALDKTPEFATPREHKTGVGRSASAKRGRSGNP